MPPRPSLTSSFSITDSNNEVVCPLRNQDGSSCRKRCIGVSLPRPRASRPVPPRPTAAGELPERCPEPPWQGHLRHPPTAAAELVRVARLIVAVVLTFPADSQEKRYRSMQEHIRRAHPEHYISKLPATEESFLLMINTPPQERHGADQPSSSATQSLSPDLSTPRNYYRDGSSNPGTPRNADEYTTSGGGCLLGTASAAAALAELHGIKSETEPDMDRHCYSDTDGRRIPRSSIELPPIQLSHNDITSDPRQREILPSLMASSPPAERSSTLPPFQRPAGPNRPRKQSVTKRGRESQHKKKNSRGSAADWLRRVQNEERLRPGNNDRKAVSAEPSAGYGTRWEDLIDAADQAASASGDIEDRTPVPQSPISFHRGSLPPFQQQQFQAGGYQASPLQQALTPPSYNQDMVDPFPSVESGESGENFHIGSRGLSDSSPSYSSSQNIQIYCAACQGVSLLKSSYACTECISGLCSTCVEVLMAEQGARRKCPRCATIGGRFKPFQLDIR
ncbi:Uncharacterized protein TCAP_05402 [Tolypocladium capitatum]|uniref:RING zinc finger-like domain-containing protein n=1 Tax=Tolypocladium capitatum TaxID=45235 RepID=A0A2K3QAT5_9HYPO|nr:Uncharacterized protein TCAP_05402 [Tolypocladium capitatum]